MKAIDHNSMDAALNDFANNGNQLHLLSANPASQADFASVATNTLGHVVLNTGAGNGAYILQAGAVSGRRLTVAQQTVPGTAVGVATCAVIIDTVHSVIKMIDTAPNYNMTIGGNQTVPSFDAWEIKDPT